MEQAFIELRVKLAQVILTSVALASEVIRAGLRALEAQETKVLNLRHMVVQGEQSGEADHSYDSLLNEIDKDNH